jgi:hypothetical protein
MPVIDTRTARTASYDRALIDNDNFSPAPCSMNRGMTPGDTSAKNNYIRAYLIHLPVIDGIGPWHYLRTIKGSHSGFLLADVIADKQTGSESA